MSSEVNMSNQPKHVLNRSKGNRDFSPCQARYDGVKDCSEVSTFLSQVARFKNKEGLSDREALTTFSKLLTGRAAHWWKEQKFSDWDNAIMEFKRKFVPPYRVYQDIINVKQKSTESTILFLMQKKSLFKCLPSPELPESAQIDMLYGQIRPEIRKCVVRESLFTFQDLINTVVDIEEKLKEVKITPKELPEPLIQMINISVGGVDEIAVLGSAAQVCLASTKLFQVLTKLDHKFIRQRHLVCTPAGSIERDTLWTETTITLKSRVIPTRFLILPECEIKDTILGLDFFEKLIMEVDNWCFKDDPSKRYEYYYEKSIPDESTLRYLKISQVTGADDKSQDKQKTKGKRKKSKQLKD